MITFLKFRTFISLNDYGTGNMIDGNWKWLVSITIDVICIVPKLCWWGLGIVDRDWELRRRLRSGWGRRRWHPATIWPFSTSSNRLGPSWNQLITYSLDRWNIIIVVLKICLMLQQMLLYSNSKALANTVGLCLVIVKEVNSSTYYGILKPTLLQFQVFSI